MRLVPASPAGADARYDLWDDIVASEWFPAGTDTGYYLLSLSRPVSSVDNVLQIEAELVSVLKVLTATWPFAGGSFIVLQTREVINSARFESNAHEVSRDLLAQRGIQHVSASTTIAFETLAGYSKFPLADATLVARAGRADVGLRRLLQYHQNAWIGYYGGGRVQRSEWFIELYKVRDMLKKIYGTERSACAKLGVERGEWKRFGAALNNHDLRHAELRDVVPGLSREEVGNLFRLARKWVAAHLRALGLPAL